MSSNDQVLTAEEAEALLEQGGASASHDASGVRVLDQAYWEQITPDRIPALEAINADLAESLNEIWQRLFKRSIVASAAEARWIKGRELPALVPNEACVAMIDVQPENEQCLLVVQPDTISAMVDLFFGGTGSSRRSERLTELTQMERRLARRFAEALVDALRTAWKRHGQTTFKLSAEDFELASHPSAAGASKSYVCAFSFDVAELSHRVELVWPASVVHRLKAQRKVALPAAKSRPDLDWSTRLREDVKDARIELRAVLGEMPIKLADIARARPGDIISTEPLTNVRVYAGDKPVFEGTLGTHRGFHAVKIRHAVNKRMFGEK
jgi:flagellar motor switch protein FliM